MPFVLLSVILVAIVVIVGIYSSMSPPKKPPEYTGQRPEPADDGYVSNQEVAVIDAPHDKFYTWINQVDLQDIMEGRDDFPRTVRTEPIRGSFELGQDRTGARRRVVLENGHYVAEEVLVDTPKVFRYMVWGFTSFQRLAINHAIGEFVYKEMGDRTQLTWTYSFKPTSVIFRPIIARFVKDTWKPYMQDILKAMKEGYVHHVGDASAPLTPDSRDRMEGVSGILP